MNTYQFEYHLAGHPCLSDEVGALTQEDALRKVRKLLPLEAQDVRIFRESLEDSDLDISTPAFVDGVMSTTTKDHGGQACVVLQMADRRGPGIHVVLTAYRAGQLAMSLAEAADVADVRNGKQERNRAMRTMKEVISLAGQISGGMPVGVVVRPSVGSAETGYRANVFGELNVASGWGASPEEAIHDLFSCLVTASGGAVPAEAPERDRASSRDLLGEVADLIEANLGPKEGQSFTLAVSKKTTRIASLPGAEGQTRYVAKVSEIDGYGNGASLREAVEVLREDLQTKGAALRDGLRAHLAALDKAGR